MDFSKFSSEISSSNPAATAAAILKGSEPTKETPITPETPEKPEATVPEGEKPPETPEKPADKDPLSSKFAALSKRETLLVKRDRELKAREASLQEKESKYSNYDKLEADRKKEVALNPLKALEYYGLTYKDLTEFVLNGETPTPDSQVKVLETRLSEFEKRAEEERKAKEEADKKSVESEHEATLKQFRESCESFVKENSETYELINLYGGTPVVIATIEQYFADSMDPETKVGKVLSFKEACDLVEKYYEDEAKKLERTKKFAKASPEPKKDSPQDPPAPSRTLNNNMSSSAPSLLPAKTENDRMQRALAALDKRA
jgi:hypothetical protein